MTVPWQYEDKIISSIEDMPKNVIGFVYRIVFTDGKQYIGKKNLYSISKVKPLKSGKPRANRISEIKLNTGYGYRETYEVIKKESNWKTYQGSHKDCKNKTPEQKYIIAYAYNKLELTYLEAKALFTYSVLERPSFLNDNILGSFYRSALYDDQFAKL